MAKNLLGSQITTPGGVWISGSADPSAGAGVTAAAGSAYQRTSDGSLWLKTGAGDTAWTLLDVGSRIFETLVGATTDTISLTGLNGNTDKHYELWAYLRIDVGDAGTDWNLHPNGVTTDLNSQVDGNGVFDSGDDTEGRFAVRNATSGFTDGDTYQGIFVKAKLKALTSGGYRQFEVYAVGGRQDSGPTAANARAGLSRAFIRWADTSTNITSIDINCSEASSILSGSWAAIRAPEVQRAL